MTEKNNGCVACGICCDLYGAALTASQSDLERWRKEGRADILSAVGEDGALWVKSDGSRQEACPFIVREGPDRAVCGIHDAKPEVCRGYPTVYHNKKCVRGVVF
ncbi:YkgJ family cysteine cluster protein [bacterium]|nr:MAG: YkgJ family cysteine cluster protein [bacterium]